MATELLSQAASAYLQSARSLLVIWQNPTSPVFTKVGQLDQLVYGRYAFRYLPPASEDPDFFPLDEFPQVERAYVSDALPSFFANRVMSHDRPHYSRYREWLDLEDDGADTPFEVLARTGGPRVTDTFHVVDPLRTEDDGKAVSRFFVSGVRYHADSDALIKRLEPGARLALRDEPGNQDNPRALLIDVADGQPVGWVPDWLVDDVHALRARDPAPEVVVERGNPDAPTHLRLLCRISARAG